MNEWMLLATALAAGFFGSPHCLGMCGGIVSALGFALQSQTPGRRLLLQSLYQFPYSCPTYTKAFAKLYA